LQANGSIANIRESQVIDNRGIGVRGYGPSIAIDSQQRVTIIYQGTSENKLWYVSGYFNTSNGRINAPERLLDINISEYQEQP
jgi:hypothetical protein